jgi:hypothetical protein
VGGSRNSLSDGLGEGGFARTDTALGSTRGPCRVGREVWETAKWAPERGGGHSATTPLSPTSGAPSVGLASEVQRQSRSPVSPAPGTVLRPGLCAASTVTRGSRLAFGGVGSLPFGPTTVLGIEDSGRDGDDQGEQQDAHRKPKGVHDRRSVLVLEAVHVFGHVRNLNIREPRKERLEPRLNVDWLGCVSSGGGTFGGHRGSINRVRCFRYRAHGSTREADRDRSPRLRRAPDGTGRARSADVPGLWDQHGRPLVPACPQLVTGGARTAVPRLRAWWSSAGRIGACHPDLP